MKGAIAENIRPVEILRQIEGVRVGKIVEIDGSGQVFIDFPGNTFGPIAARFTNSLKLQILGEAATTGQEVLLAFENNDPKCPIIIDLLSSLVDQTTDALTVNLQTEKPEIFFVNGKRITFDANEEITLRCGKASITLTSTGKVIIRGAYLLSRSFGVNRIQGGSVRIN